jgi:hypothetical protein
MKCSAFYLCVLFYERMAVILLVLLYLPELYV